MATWPGQDRANFKRPEEASRYLAAALAVRPTSARARLNLSNALLDLGDLDGAETLLREAIRLKPDSMYAHLILGNVLDRQGKTAAAIAEFREAIRLNPGLASVYKNLGRDLAARGDLDAAIEALRQIRDRVASDPRLRQDAEILLAQAERAERLSLSLPAVVSGDYRPGNADELLDFAALCLARKLAAAAARLYAAALSAHPALAGDRRAQHPYHAACAAALAGCGQGKDDPPPDDVARTRLRREALDWLRAERSAWAKLLDSGPPQARPLVVQTLQHWKADADLAGVRDPDALVKLPEAEREDWQSLWAEVDALLRRARTGDDSKLASPDEDLSADPFSF